jgi:hypothetical protein
VDVNPYHNVRVNILYDKLTDIRNGSIAIQCPDLARKVTRWLLLESRKQRGILVVNIVSVARRS